jgi:uncharacterized protein YwqG
MLPLCQLNLSEMPFVPPNLNGVHLITVFISAVSLPVDAENGDGWQLRAYPSLDGLVHIETPQLDSAIRAFPIRWELVEADYPSYEDVAFEFPADVSSDYYDLFELCPSSKVGGWHSLIQSEIYWAPHTRHPANPECVFQIASEEKAHWQWGDAGIGYFGRGTGKNRDVWVLGWQCY